MLLPNLFCTFRFVRVLSCVEDIELGPEEVRSYFAYVTLCFFRKLILFKTYEIVRCCLSGSFLTTQQEFVSIGKSQRVLRKKTVESSFISRDRALNLSYPWRDWFHIHLFELFHWGKGVSQLCYEFIVQLLIFRS